MITPEQCKKIITLIKTNDIENVQLAVNILKNQDVHENFFSFLKIACQWHAETRILRTGMANVKSFVDYLILNKNLNAVITKTIYTELETYLKLYELYINELCPYQHDTARIKAERKELILCYDLPANKTLKRITYAKNKKRT